MNKTNTLTHIGKHAAIRLPALVLLLSFIIFSAYRFFPTDSFPKTVTKKNIEIMLQEGTNMAASISPDKQQIAIDLLGRLWLLPVAGGQAQAITDSLGDARQPSWAPDGRALTFQAYWDGNWHIYRIQTDGSQLQQLTYGPYDHREPHWSPDGHRIIFSSDQKGNYDIWELNLQSGKKRQLTDDSWNEYGPAYSPEGKRIAYLSDNPTQKGIYLLSLERGKAYSFYRDTAKLAGLSWSPNAQEILFNRWVSTESHLMMARVDQYKKVVQLSQKGEDVFPFRASWLSDTEYIYTATGQITKRKLKKKAKKIIPFQAKVSLERHTYTKKQRNFDPSDSQPVKGIVWPSISPDGQQIAFVALGDIWLQAGSSKAQALTNDAFVDMFPSWSPDGKQLAYVSDRQGSFAIWLREMESGKEQKIVPITGTVSGLSWSPDGGHIAYSVNFGPRLGQLWTLDLGNGKSTKIGAAVSSSIGSPSWSANGQTLAISLLKPYSTLYREGINRTLFYSTKEGESWQLKGMDHWSISARGKDGPIWSPDGKYMAMIAYGVLWIVAVDQEGQAIGSPIRLTNELADAPSWTGDSKQLLYMATDRLKKIHIINGEVEEVPIRLSWSRHAPAVKSIIHVGALFDGIDEELQENMDIIIERNRIVEIAPHDPQRSADQKIDASHSFAMPGLIDIHAHQGSWGGEKLGRSWLAWGVTSTRDPATDPYDALNRKEAHESGKTINARIFFTGSPIDGSRVYYAGTYAQQAPAQLELELQRAKALDYDMIKTYVRLPNALQKRVVEYAHSIGLHVSSHELYPAVSYGTDGVEHIMGTSRRGYSPKMSQTLRAYGDVSSLLGASGMTFTPTIGIYVGYDYLLAHNEAVLKDERLAKLESSFNLQAAYQRIEHIRKDPISWETKFSHALKMIKDIHDKGGTIVAGTDSPIIPYGFALQLELEAYVAAGLTPFEALQSATINSARVLGADKDLGSLEEGKLADIVIVDANPLENIRHSRNIQWVIQNGNIYTLAELLK